MLKDQRNILGILFILLGIFLVLEQFGLIPPNAREYIAAGLFAVATVVMFGLYFANRSRWWAVMVGFFLSGLAATALLGVIAPELSERLGGAVFMGALGLGFASVYIINRDLWWAIIPSGVMFSLAAVIVAESQPNLPFEPAGILFTGMGLTFGLLALLQRQRKDYVWAIYPAIPLLVFGLALAFGTAEAWAVLGPLMLIAGGAWLLLNARRKGNPAR